MRELFYKIINIISVIIFIWIMFMMVIGDNVEYFCKVSLKVGNIKLLIIGLLMIVVTVLWYSKIKFKITKIDSYKFIKVFSCIFFILQIVIYYNIFFETGWDSGNCIVPTVKMMLENGDISQVSAYYQWYPNNLLMVNIFYIILRVGKILQIKGTYQLMPIVAINCAISTLSCWLTYLIVKKYLPQRYAVVSYFCTIFLVGLSGWNVICYSDSLALFFPIVILYVCLVSKISDIKKNSLVIILGYIGYCIKPQTVIVTIAIVIVNLIRLITENDKNIKSNLLKAWGISFISVLILSSLLNTIYLKEGFLQNKDMKIGMSHFFMMGTNVERTGVYSDEDVAVSLGCQTAEERRRVNYDVAFKRIKELGIGGYLKFLSKKMLVNYNDATFAWGREGEFYKTVYEPPYKKVSTFLRDMYYNDGKYYEDVSIIRQLIWVMILFAICIGNIKFLFCMEKDEKMSALNIMQLSLIGITVFELLFEARARYLYIYVPFYIIVAMFNFDSTKNIVFGKVKDVFYLSKK